MSKTLIVTGSRHFDDRKNTVGFDGSGKVIHTPLVPHAAWMYEILSESHEEHGFHLVVHGQARGADTIADQWAALNSIKVESFPADWNKFGKKAGTLRNLEMLDAYPDALVIGFPAASSIGTWHCINAAKKRGMDVNVFEWRGQ